MGQFDLQYMPEGEFPNPLVQGTGLPPLGQNAQPMDTKQNPLLVYGSIPARFAVEMAKGLWDTVKIPGNARLHGFDLDSPEAIPQALALMGLLAGPPAGPKGSVGVFGGHLAATADIDALAAAQSMLKKGLDPKEIYQNTGWFKASDGNWKNEISDVGAKWREPKVGSYHQNTTLGEALDHPDLFAAYPHLEDMKFREVPGMDVFGEFDPNTKTISLRKGMSDEQRTSVLLHEINHVIAEHEGFARGGNPGYMRRQFYPERVNFKALMGAINIRQALEAGHIGPKEAAERVKTWGALSMKGADALEKLVEHPLEKLKALYAGYKDILPINPKINMYDPDLAYHRIAGEVDSRAVQERWRAQRAMLGLDKEAPAGWTSTPTSPEIMPEAFSPYPWETTEAMVPARQQIHLPFWADQKPQIGRPQPNPHGQIDYATGNPLAISAQNAERETLYHGTSKDKPYKNFRDARNGTWFDTNPEEASMYALQNDSMGYKFEGHKVVPTNTASRVSAVHHNFENTFTTQKLPEFVQKAENYKKAQIQWFDDLRAKGYDSVRIERPDGHATVVSLDNRKIEPKYSKEKMNIPMYATENPLLKRKSK
jgi:Large polyvalent protein associated domain 23